MKENYLKLKGNSLVIGVVSSKFDEQYDSAPVRSGRAKQKQEKGEV